MGGQNRPKRGYKSTLAVILTVLVAGMGIAWASETLNWTFSFDNPIQFEPTQVELVGDIVRLNPLDQGDSVNNGFSGGTFHNTFWGSQNQRLSVVQSLTLPDNAVPKSETAWADMTGNMLLLHFDSSVIFQGTGKTYSDASGQNLSPTCAKATCPQLDANGKLGTALWFDGTNDALSLPGSWGGADWTEVTAEAWIRVDGVTAAADKMQAIVSATAANMLFHFQMLATADKFNVAVYTNSGSTVVGFNPSAPALALGVWHHVAVSIKSGNIVLYADGKVAGSSAFAFNNLSPIGAGQQLRIGSGYAKARFFRGALDEVAVYKRALSAEEIKSHFDQQSSSFAGHYDSRILNVGSPAEWTSLSWVSSGPNGVQLPDKPIDETGYAVDNANMAGNVLLMHLNENSGIDFSDASGQGNKGTCAGTGCPALGVDGKFATAASFDGVDDQISIPSNPSVSPTKAVTVEAWIYPKVIANAQDGSAIVAKGTGANFNDAHYELLLISSLIPNVHGLFFRLAGHSTVDSSDNVAKSYIYGGNIPLNSWSHVAGTYDGSVMSLYLNGLQIMSQPASGGPITTDSKPLMIGVRQVQSTATGKSHFNGKIDEVAVYDRALTATEIQARYLRGAVQPKFQVRSCDKADCAGSDFKGPGNSDKTYYMPSALATSPPQTAVLSGVAKNPYFQYRAFFDSRSATLFPALKSVAIGPSHFPTTSPSVVIPTGQPFAVLDSFADVTGDANKGEVRYQLSSDGTDWYFCYGTQWQKTTDPLAMVIPELGELQKTNSASKVNQCAPSFAAIAGAGKIFIKAFLHALSPTEVVELKQLNVGYQLKAPVAPPPPPPPEPKSVVLSDMPTLTVAEGAKFNLTMDVSKAGLAAPYQYACQANCPEGMSIHSDSGEVSWTPTYQQAGKYANIQFKATDAAGKEATQALSVIVTDATVAPKIDNPGDKVVTVGQNISFTVSATDGDGGVPTYTIASGKQEGMELNASTGFFSWTPKPEQAGTTIVMLRAVDGADPNVVSDQAISIMVGKAASDSMVQAAQPQSLPEPTIPTTIGTQATTQAQPVSPAGPAEPAAPTVVSGCALIKTGGKL